MKKLFVFLAMMLILSAPALASDCRSTIDSTVIDGLTVYRVTNSELGKRILFSYGEAASEASGMEATCLLLSQWSRAAAERERRRGIIKRVSEGPDVEWRAVER